ncbi:MAG: hypothetical protein QXK45_06710 [Thermofilaceae archaeon]
MATIRRPRLLAFQTGIEAQGYSNVFAPSGNVSWEVNSIIVTGPAVLERAFDTNGDGLFEYFVEVDSVNTAEEFHGFKFQCDQRAGLRVKNAHNSSVLSVFLLGCEIED